MQHLIHTRSRKKSIHRCGKCIDPHLQQILKSGAYHMKRQIKNDQHDTDKARNRCIFSSQNPVNLLTSYPFPALFWFHHRLFTDFFNKCKTHIGDSSAPVKSTLFFHLHDQMFDGFFFVFIQVQFFQDQVISLDNF